MAARALNPSGVLDAQVQLIENLRHPAPGVASYYSGFMESVLRDAEAKGGEEMRSAAGVYLFYPAEDGYQFAQVLSRQLSWARAFQVTAEMTDAVTATYLKSMEHIDNMDEREVPEEAGFCWLDKPLEFIDATGKRVVHRALSWARSTIKFSDGDAWPGVRITAWCHTDDEDDFWDTRAMADLKSVGFDALTLSHSVLVPFGQRFLRREDMKVAPPTSFTSPLLSQLSGEQAGPYSDDLARWTHTLFMFLDMEITASEKPPVERHARKRAERSSLNHSDVSVITLRRIARAKEGEPGHRYVDWSCRWPVQGFYRHIESYAEQHHHAVPGDLRTHCAVCGARISWVRPHLRGPSDKPLKQPRQLFRLAR